MNLVALQQQLADAEAHVALGDGLVRHQKEVVAELLRDGHPSDQARKLLASFEDRQTILIADRDRLRDELAQARARLADPAGTVSN